MSGSDFTLTPNYGLYKPTPNADIDGWGGHLNANSDTLDSVIKTISNQVSAQDALNVVNVLNHGAKGDGTTDDTAAIQALLNAYAGKARVFIPRTSGGYIVSGLTLPSFTDLLLYGTITLKAAATIPPVSVTSASNVGISGTGTIDGNASAQTGTATLAGLAIAVSSNVRVSGITLTNSFNWNLNVTQSSNVVIDGVTFTGGRSASQFALVSNNCWLTNCIFDGTGNADYAFAFYLGVTNSGAIGNTIANAGIGTSSAPPAIGILSDGAVSRPCSNIVITNNILYNSAGPGIQVVSTGAASGIHSGIIISNNRCYNNNMVGGGGTSGAAMFINWVNNILINGNQVSDNGSSTGPYYTGMFIGPNTTRINVKGNQVYNVGSGLGPATGANNNAGIYASNPTDAFISGNQFYDNQTTPSMAYSVIGAVGARSAFVENYFGRPFNCGVLNDTVVANAFPTKWVFGIDNSTLATTVAINGPATVNRYLLYETNSVPRWFVGLGGAESGSDTGSDFYFQAAHDSGGLSIVPLLINRFSGQVTARWLQITNTTNAANDAAAASAGVPVGGVYRNASVLMVRTV